MPLFVHPHAGFTPQTKIGQENTFLTLRHGHARIATSRTHREHLLPLAPLFSAQRSRSHGERAGSFPLRSLQSPFDGAPSFKISRESPQCRSLFRKSASEARGDGSAPVLEQTSCCGVKGVLLWVLFADAEFAPLPFTTADLQGLPGTSGVDSVRMKGDAAQNSLASAGKIRKEEGTAEPLKKRRAGYHTIRNHFALLCLPYLTVAALIGTMHRTKRSRRHHDRRQRKLLHVVTERRALKGTPCTAPKNYRVPDNLAATVLAKLETLEKNLFFLEKGMTLHKLAARLNTNTTYLSAIIREHKDLPFNAYMKQLRISYVTRMLCENRQWRRYTVETLAAECGFKDRTHFARSFADYHGITLAEFILKREREQIFGEGWGAGCHSTDYCAASEGSQ